MSMNLLRQSLDQFELANDKTKVDKKKGQKNKEKNFAVQKTSKRVAVFAKAKVKNLKQSNEDATKVNMKKIKRLDKMDSDSRKLMLKVSELRQAKLKQPKASPQQSKSSKKESASVFTDRDFDKFEREYNFN